MRKSFFISVFILLSGCARAPVPTPMAEETIAPSTIGSPLLGLIRLAPYDTQVLVVADLRHKLDLGTAVQGARRAGAKVTRGLERFQRDLGLSAEEIASWARPAVLLVSFPPKTGAPLWDVGAPLIPETALVVELSDRKKAAAALDKVSAALATSLAAPADSLVATPRPLIVKIEGTPVQLNVVGDAVWVYVIEGDHLIITRSLRAMEKMLNTARGNAQNLSQNPAFARPAQNLPAGDGCFGYVALQPSLATLSRGSWGKTHCDEVTMKGLSGLEYGVGTFQMDGETLSGQSHFRVDPKNSSPFIQAFLQPATGNLTAMQLVPAESRGVLGLNLNYAANVFIETARLDRSLRPNLSADLLTSAEPYLEPLLGSSLVAARWDELDPDHKAYVACLKSISALKDEVYDWHRLHGHYPKSIATVARKFCPVSRQPYLYELKGEQFSLICPGHAHAGAGVGSSTPRYSTLAGLSPQPREDWTGLLVLPCKSSQAATNLVSKVRPFLFREDEILSKSDGVDIRGSGAKAWAIVEHPCPALLFAEGFHAQAFLKASIRAGVTGNGTIAQESSYQPLAKENEVHSFSIVGTELLNGPLLEQRDLVDWAGYDDLLFLVEKQFLPLEGSQSSIFRLDPDGIHVTSRGGGVSTLLHLATLSKSWGIWDGFTGNRSPLYECERCQEKIAGALELYAAQHDGQYPPGLTFLVPNYLIKLPVCPLKGKAPSYQSSGSDYLLSCPSSHPDLAPGSPHYSHSKGPEAEPEASATPSP